MSALASKLLEPQGIHVSYTTRLRDIRDGLVVVHKSYLEDSDLKSLHTLRRRGCLVVGDFIDAKISDTVLGSLDGVLASSLKQMDYLKSRTDKPIFHVTQPVDIRFPDADVPDDRLRLAYFGASQNAQYRQELSHLVDFIETPGESRDWMELMKNYNCHYAVRRRQNFDGFKPFGKGFVAARYGCPIVVSADEDDALAYLGKDYPYFVSDASLPEVEATIARMRDDFGGPRWNQAKRIMESVRERSTLDVVRAELQDFVEFFAARYSVKPNSGLFGFLRNLQPR
jgi:hypothetical protein